MGIEHGYQSKGPRRPWVVAGRRRRWWKVHPFVLFQRHWLRSSWFNFQLYLNTCPAHIQLHFSSWWPDGIIQWLGVAEFLRTTAASDGNKLTWLLQPPRQDGDRTWWSQGNTCLACMQPWVWPTPPHKSSMVAHVCNSRWRQVNQKFKVILSCKWVQGHPRIHEPLSQKNKGGGDGCTKHWL